MTTIVKNIIGFISTSAMVFAFTFEGMIGLGANYEANKALMEERVRLSQTVRGQVVEQAVKSNMTAIEQYDQTLKTEYRVYGCGQDRRCR